MTRRRKGMVLALALALGVSIVVGDLPRKGLAHAAGCPSGMANILGRFCIDRYEAYLEVITADGATVRRHSPYYTPAADALLRAHNRQGAIPQAYLSQHQAQAACAAAGKRLCTDAEWVTACKGRPPTLYPYGTAHQLGRCNDRGVSPLRQIHGRDDSTTTFGFEPMNDPRLNQVPGGLARTGTFSGCRNSFGVYDMVGNLHEWTADSTGTFRGGYYLDTFQHGQGCEYQTRGHSPRYHDYSIGFRCCKGLVDGKTVSMPPPSPTPPLPRSRQQAPRLRHTVEKGETLSHIARRYGITVAELCRLNHLDRQRPIRPGQELLVKPD